jgi:predicted lipoprotein with Yx(FWY)xxD motif
MRLLALLTAALAVLVIASPSMGAQRSAVGAHASRYGTILFDGRGFVLYAFTKDPRGHSACSGTCAKRWPPYLVGSRAVAAAGANARLLGTIRRGDGTKQVTYAGRPLYYYVGDRSPGQILCQNVFEFGGRWLVVRPSGRPVG